MQVAVRGIALDEGAICHPRIIEHEVSPHELDQINGPFGEAREEVRLHLEARCKRWDGCTCLGAGAPYGRIQRFIKDVLMAAARSGLTIPEMMTQELPSCGRIALAVWFMSLSKKRFWTGSHSRSFTALLIPPIADTHVLPMLVSPSSSASFMLMSKVWYRIAFA
jgi:hypothetical protein